MKAIFTKYDLTAENELAILLEINHENIVKYYDHFDLNISGDDHTFIIMEYCEVSLNQSQHFRPFTSSIYNKTKHRTVH